MKCSEIKNLKTKEAKGKLCCSVESALLAFFILLAVSSVLAMLLLFGKVAEWPDSHCLCSWYPGPVFNLLVAKNRNV